LINETLFVATIMCPYCSYEFRVCLQADQHPNDGERYEVNCPSHGGPSEFVAAGSIDIEREDFLLVLARSLQEGEHLPLQSVRFQVERCDNSLPNAHLVRKQRIQNPIKRLLAWLGLS
jgi:hypothetical protein